MCGFGSKSPVFKSFMKDWENEGFHDKQISQI